MKNEPENITVHGRRLACANSKFEVFFDHIEWTDGQQVKDYLVVAPRSSVANLVTGVSILPVVDGKFGLIRVYRHAIRSFVWEVPRGFIDEGETALTSAVRELEEESGLICREENMQSLGMIAPEAGTLAARVHLFAALNCVRREAFHTTEFGHQDLRYFGNDEMMTMAENSEIQDPGTLVAYFKFRALSSRG